MWPRLLDSRLDPVPSVLSTRRFAVFADFSELSSDSGLEDSDLTDQATRFGTTQGPLEGLELGRFLAWEGVDV